MKSKDMVQMIQNQNGPLNEDIPIDKKPKKAKKKKRFNTVAEHNFGSSINVYSPSPALAPRTNTKSFTGTLGAKPIKSKNTLMRHSY
jgi:hypothetical protein